MKNREKAEALGKIHARQYHHNTFEGGLKNSEFVFSNNEIEIACNEMAEWKDTIHKAEMDRLYNAIKDYLPIEVRRKIKRVFFNE